MKYLTVLFLALSFSTVAAAQAPPDPLETGWTWSVSGGYSSLQNQATNNGFLTSAEVRVAKHWLGFIDQISVGKPSATGFLVGGSYDLSLAHWAKKSSFIDLSKFEIVIGAGAGAMRAAADASPFKVAFEVKGAVRYNLPGGTFIEPLDVRYLRSAVTGSQVVGNHAQFAALFGKRF